MTISVITFLDMYFGKSCVWVSFLSLPPSHVSGAPGSISDEFLPRMGLYLSLLAHSLSFVLGIGDTKSGLFWVSEKTEICSLVQLAFKKIWGWRGRREGLLWKASQIIHLPL